jgi:DNA helicase HerA-like ATPase
MDLSQVTYIGKTDFRNQMTQFGIRAKDRFRHMYIIGKSGTGKTTLIENLIVQDIYNGNGIAFLDPHGESAEKLLRYIPTSRINDVIYFNPGDSEFPDADNARFNE